MTAIAAGPASANPFSRRASLAIVGLGALFFLGMLWMIGAGLMNGPANDGGNHAQGKGLNGYAAMAGFLEKRGYDVSYARSIPALHRQGLLILTPPHNADAKEIDDIVADHRWNGPTIVVTPKWRAVKVPPVNDKAKPGWVQLYGAQIPDWPGFLDDVGVRIDKAGGNGRWRSRDGGGPLPDTDQVLSGSGVHLVPLVTGGNGQILAAYVDDGSYQAGLGAMALSRPNNGVGEDEYWPLIVVFEPDLLDNYGFADKASALFVERLVSAAMDGERMPIVFDLTLNGHARTANLLTLAFTPPFLAATLCLLMAALAAGWRAFLRFGPPVKASRAIAYGKRALVANAAGLIRRTRRLHLIGGPYATRVRERIVHALALPRQRDIPATEAAIDRALSARAPQSEPFSKVAARLRNAGGAHELLKAAQDLRALERILTHDR